MIYFVVPAPEKQSHVPKTKVLITRGLAEMTRIGTAYGASPLTFLSLAGVGDLFLTCSSPTSRNYTVGHRLGKGEKLDDIIRTLGSVAEGVTTAKGLKKIIEELGVSAPIANGVGIDNHLYVMRRLIISSFVCFFLAGLRCAVRRYVIAPDRNETTGELTTVCRKGRRGASTLANEPPRDAGA